MEIRDELALSKGDLLAKPASSKVPDQNKLRNVDFGVVSGSPRKKWVTKSDILQEKAPVEKEKVPAEEEKKVPEKAPVEKEKMPAEKEKKVSDKKVSEKEPVEKEKVPDKKVSEKAPVEKEKVPDKNVMAYAQGKETEVKERKGKKGKESVGKEREGKKVTAQAKGKETKVKETEVKEPVGKKGKVQARATEPQDTTNVELSTLLKKPKDKSAKADLLVKDKPKTQYFEAVEPEDKPKSSKKLKVYQKKLQKDSDDKLDKLESQSVEPVQSKDEVKWKKLLSLSKLEESKKK